MTQTTYKPSNTAKPLSKRAGNMLQRLQQLDITGHPLEATVYCEAAVLRLYLTLLKKSCLTTHGLRYAKDNLGWIETWLDDIEVSQAKEALSKTNIITSETQTNRENGNRLPPDPDGLNDDRAAWAGSALALFMHITGTDEDAALGDLLANLMHLADRTNHDFNAALDRARYHYYPGMEVHQVGRISNPAAQSRIGNPAYNLSWRGNMKPKPSESQWHDEPLDLIRESGCIFEKTI